MSRLTHWTATRRDGSAVEYDAIRDGKTLPDDLREVRVEMDDGGSLRIRIQPGERLRLYTRRRIVVGADLIPLAEQPPDTAVIELAPDREHPERFVRLYLGAESVLSTEDLYG